MTSVATLSECSRYSINVPLMCWHGTWTEMVCCALPYLLNFIRFVSWTVVPASVKLKHAIDDYVKVGQLLSNFTSYISSFKVCLRPQYPQDATLHCVHMRRCRRDFPFCRWSCLPNVQHTDLLQQLGRCKHQNDYALTTCELRPLTVSNDCLKLWKEVERSYDIQWKIYNNIHNHRYYHTLFICPTERVMMVYVDNILLLWVHHVVRS